MKAAARRRFAEEDVRAEIGELRTEVERLAAELEEMRLHAQTLEALALEDPLTGLLNRRGFLRELARAIAYRARYGTPAALLLADLDRFKPINDAHGHEVGDRALAHLAALLRGNVRASDSVGRLGGDEFALVIWHVDEGTARQKAASLQGVLAAKPFSLPGIAVELRASIGVTMLEPDDAPEAAVGRADRDMYRQKAERRAPRGRTPRG
jgi:diguanylate cyclase (GGDEF)-like protein